QPHAVRAGGSGIDAGGVLHAIHVCGLVVPEVRQPVVFGLGLRSRLYLRQCFLHFCGRGGTWIFLDDLFADGRRQCLAVLRQHLLVELQFLVGGGFVRGGLRGGRRRGGWRWSLLRAGGDRKRRGDAEGRKHGDRKRTGGPGHACSVAATLDRCSSDAGCLDEDGFRVLPFKRDIDGTADGSCP